MANTLRFKRGLVATIPTALAGEPLFTTDTFDLYIGNGTTNTRFQKYIASGATTQILRGDGSLYTFPLAISSPSAGQVLKYNGTNWVNDSDAGITGSLTTNYLPKATGATTLGNSLVFDNGTNVGIRTNAPVSYDVSSQVVNIVTSVANAEIKLTNSTTGNTATAGFLIAQYGVETFLWNGSNGSIAFGTNNLQRARLTSGGNLLLGSNTDNGLRFQVTGDGYFSGSVGIGTTSLTARNFVVGKNITGAATSTGIRQDGIVQSDVTNVFGIINTLNSAAASFTISNYYHFIGGQGTIGVGSSVTNQYAFWADGSLTGATNNFGFYGNIASGTGRWNLYMNGTAANYLAGNLSIGTTSTDIFSRGDARNVVISATGASDNMSLQLNAGASGGRGAQIYMGAGGTRYFTIGTNVNETQIGTVTSTPIIFYTNNAEKMRLFADGNFGINTGSTNAGFKLDVNGTMRVSGQITGNSFVPTSNTIPTNGMYLPTTNTLGYATNSTERMRIDASGNVSIAQTQSAAYRLDVVGSGIRTAPTAGSTGLWGSLVIGSTLDSTSNYFDAFRITGSGAGTYSAAANNILFQRWDGSTWTTQLTINQFSGAATFSSSVTAASFNGTTNNIFSTGGTERMRLDASGNLGLGVTPSAWRSVLRAFEIGIGSIVGRPAVNQMFVKTNAYTNSSAQEIYIQNGLASQYLQTDGIHAWYNAPSGTAGNAITFTQAMTLFATGNLAVGTTTDAGFKLDVNGTMRVSGASTFNANMALTLNQNASTTITITNTTSGTDASSVFRAVTNSSAEMQFGKFSSTRTAYKIINSSDGFLFNNIAGDIAILNDFGAGSIKFAAGGSSTAHFTIASSGAATFSSSLTVDTDTFFVDATNNRVGVGTITPSYKAHIVNNASSPTYLALQNTTAGSTSAAIMKVISDASSGSGEFLKKSSTGNTYKVMTSNDLVIYNDTAGDIDIFNDHASGKINLTSGGSSSTHLTLDTSGRLGFSNNSPTAYCDLAASTTAIASLRIRSGSAPTAPNDGDIWFDGTDLKIRVAGVTKTFTLV